MKKRKTLRIVLFLAACGLAGFFAGLGMAFAGGEAVQQGYEALEQALGRLAPFLQAATILGCTLGAVVMARKGKALAAHSEDDEKALAAETAYGWAMQWLEISMVLSFLYLPLAWAAPAPAGYKTLMAASCLTLLNAALTLYGQHRIVTAVKTLCPEKQGDIREMNFNKKWYSSCDEAERAQIGYAAYKTFIATQNGVLATFIVLMLARGIVDFGSLPFIVLAGLWLLMKLSYAYYCNQKMK